MYPTGKKETVYDKCAYEGCTNGRLTTNCHLFRFPAYGDPRHKVWIKNSGNVALRKWSANSIRRTGLCGDHFTMNSFFDSSRRRLRRYAVPVPYKPENPSNEKETEADLSLDNNNEITHEEQNISKAEEAETEKDTNESQQDVSNTPNVDEAPDDADSDLITRKEAPLRTYASRLKFDVPAEKEDVATWMNIEPSTSAAIGITNTPTSTQSNLTKAPTVTLSFKRLLQEKASADIMIQSVKNENILLRRQMKNLKLRLQRCLQRLDFAKLKQRMKRKNLKTIGTNTPKKNICKCMNLKTLSAASDRISNRKVSPKCSQSQLVTTDIIADVIEEVITENQ